MKGLTALEFGLVAAHFAALVQYRRGAEPWPKYDPELSVLVVKEILGLEITRTEIARAIEAAQDAIEDWIKEFAQ